MTVRILPMYKTSTEVQNYISSALIKQHSVYPFHTQVKLTFEGDLHTVECQTGDDQVSSLLTGCPHSRV